jgi:hypothetical protein
MVMGLPGFIPEKGCAYEEQQQLKITDPDLSLERAPKISMDCIK